MWPLLILGGALVFLSTRPAPAPKVVTLKVGRVYRLKLKVLKSSQPITRELIDGFKQGLELSGMRDVRVTYGTQPTVEYTQTTQVETSIEIGKENTLELMGVSVTIVFLWAREQVQAGT